ncbi:MAG: DUF3106 domain-containing protein, partial [Xanthomonadales bacterium]|nr:DUF3106 domain-containing protein [Xanthomonadales bacterium]
MMRTLNATICACLLALPCLALAASGAPNPPTTPPSKSTPATKPVPHNPRWQQLTPQQRVKVREHAREFRHMDPKQRQRVRDAYRYYHSLPPNEREHLRKQWQQHPQHTLKDGRDGVPASSHSEYRARPSLNRPLNAPPS